MTTRPEGFDEAWENIFQGWLTINDFGDVTDRIEDSADLMKKHGVKLEDLDVRQRATIKFAIERQIAMGIMQGDFDDCFDH